jgi:hypothetical protein
MFDEPNPRRILAVLIGASSFRRAPSLAQGRAFYKSAEDFRDYLLAPGGLGLPSENVNWLFDDARSPSDQLQDIGSFLESRSFELKDDGIPPQDLIIYYVGHGLFSESDQAYCLAIRGLDERSKGLTSIRGSDLASIIKAHARFLRKFLILDCCFSAAVYKEFQSGPLQAGRVKLLDEFPQKGTTLLCSASAQDVSIAPQGLGHTMFSDSLLKSLREGCPSLGPRLSLNELGDLIKVNLREAYPRAWVRPEVQSPDQREGDVAGIPLFPNVAYAAQKAEAGRERVLGGEKTEADWVAHEQAKQQWSTGEEAGKKKSLAWEESERREAAAEEAATELAEFKQAEKDLVRGRTEGGRATVEIGENQSLDEKTAGATQTERTVDRLLNVTQSHEHSGQLSQAHQQEIAAKSGTWKLPVVVIGTILSMILSIIVIPIWYWKTHVLPPPAESQTNTTLEAQAVQPPSSPVGSGLESGGTSDIQPPTRYVLKGDDEKDCWGEIRRISPTQWTGYPSKGCSTDTDKGGLGTEVSRDEKWFVLHDKQNRTYARIPIHGGRFSVSGHPTGPWEVLGTARVLPPIKSP